VTDDDARRFQQVSQFAFYTFVAPALDIPQLSDVQLDGDALVVNTTTSSKANNGVMVPGSVVHDDARTDEQLAMRLSMASHALVAWRHSAPLQASSIRGDDKWHTVAAAPSVAEPVYTPGAAAALVAREAMLTDEAGDRVLSEGASVFVLAVVDERDATRGAAADGREVRLFVSSTFKDMLVERDALMRKVLPSLTQFAAERGIRITPVDLRWYVHALFDAF
jgi:hypothetical protein